MSSSGTVEGSAVDGSGFILRWTVDGFLKRAQEDYVVRSPDYRFRTVTFSLLIPDSFGSGTYEPEVHLRWPVGSRPPIPFSWKLSVESGDGTILQCAEGVKKLIVCDFTLGLLRDVESLLQPDGSLVLLWELRRIPEATAANSSPLLQYPAEVTKLARQNNNRTSTDGAGKNGLSEPSPEGERDAHPSTRTFGILQQNVSCTRGTWIVPNYQELAERETLNICSERFHFGSRVWQIRLLSPHSSQPSAVKEADVLLSLDDVGGHEMFSPFSWKLSTEDGGGAILQSNGGVCEEAKGTRDLTLPLGPLRDFRRFLDSKCILRVSCELCLLKETTDASSQSESEAAGIDALVRDYEKLLSSGEATDATVRVKGQREFLVHRAILVARTPVFASMFRHRMSENETGVVDVEDCDPDIFRRFLHFVYSGSLEDLRPEVAMDLYRVADKYQVDELKSRCLQCMRTGLGIETFCPTISLALQHCERELTERATEFFADNVDDIVLTTEWQEFLSNNPIQANELFVKALLKKNALLEQAQAPNKGAKE